MPIQSNHEIATELLSSGTAALALGKLPVEVQDSAADYAAAVQDMLKIGADVAAEHAKLDAQRDLLPGSGYNRLSGQLRQEANTRTREADKRATDALNAVQDHLVSAASPKVNPAREQLDRQEALLSIGSADGDKLVGRMTQLAAYGTPDVAAIFTDSTFGTSLLAARGVQDPAGEIQKIKRAVAERGVGGTEQAQLASAALRSMGTFAGARVAAEMHASQSAGGR